MSRPLEGLTIVEHVGDAAAAERIAVALAGRIAADLGAVVLKLEPPAGDPLRSVPPLIGRTGALFAFLNAGKKSVTVEGEEVVRRLTRRARGLLADAPTCAAWGGEVGRDLAEGAVTAKVSVSMHGGEGGRRPASAFTVMALGGMLDIVGDPRREPLRLGGHQLAYAGGLAAYAGLVSALCRTPEAGCARRGAVEVDLLETAIWLNWKSVASADHGVVPTRPGPAADWPVVRCRDGWVALVYMDADWPALLALTGDDPRLADPALARAAGRASRNREIADVVGEHVAGLTRQELHDFALARRIPLGPVAECREVADDPHALARGFLAPVAVDGRAIALPRLPVLWDGMGLPPGDLPGRGAPEGRG